MKKYVIIYLVLIALAIAALIAVSCNEVEQSDKKGDTLKAIQPLVSAPPAGAPPADQIYTFYFADSAARWFNYYVIIPGLDEGPLGNNSPFSLPVRRAGYWVITSNYQTTTAATPQFKRK